MGLGGRGSAAAGSVQALGAGTERAFRLDGPLGITRWSDRSWPIAGVRHAVKLATFARFLAGSFKSKGALPCQSVEE